MRFPASSSLLVRILGVLAVMVVLLVSLPPVQTMAETAGTTARLRIGVTADGLVRITPADLSAAGVDPTTVDPRTFAMTSLGQSIAIRVTGESDGHFDSVDRIEFFGQQFLSSLPDALDRQQEEKYTDERVYWLDIGGTAGPRILSVDGTPQGSPTPPTSFMTTVHAEVNRTWWPLLSLSYDTRETWYWDLVQVLSAGSTAMSYPYTTPFPAPGFMANIRLETLPRDAASVQGSNPIHRLTVSLANTLVADASWSGLVRNVIAGTVSSNLLTSPTTEVKVQVFVQSPSTKELMYINYWEMDYRRLFRAYNDRLDFKAENAGLQEFNATDFTSSPVAVWDVTSPTQPKRLSGVAVTPGAGGTYSARFRVTPAVNDRFWMQGEGSFSAPSSITLRPSTGLRAPSGGADTVIITPAFLRPAAETLATWHRAHGRRTVVADLQDVYDEFNDGIRHPVAVRKMLAWAAANWTAPAPAYLVLMGDGHFNLKNYSASSSLYAPATNPFPPYLIFKDPWLGEIASDGLFGDYTGDDLPDVAVGRIPVNTLSEANLVVNKIITYDESVRLQPWQQRAVFIADRYPDPAGAGDFWTMSDDAIQNHTPSDLAAQRVYLGSTAAPDVATAKAAVASAINSGVLMVQFTGHGIVQYWSREVLWHVTDVPLLSNGAKLPIVMSFNCMDGYFTYPASSYQSLAETMFRYDGGGSVAAITPSGEGLVPDQANFRRIMLDTMFKDGVRELGRALLVAKQQYVQTYGMNYLMYAMNFFGDPAMRIPQAPAVTATRSGNNVSLSWPAVTAMVPPYDIWRSTQPFFDPDATDCNCTKIGQTRGLSFVDNGSIGDVAHNYFYMVRAQNNSTGKWFNFNRTGEFDFALRPGQ